LLEGIDDINYERVFKQVIGNIIEKYRPEAIVMQCGSDSLSGDRIGSFNLSVRGHGNCVKYVKSLNLPLLLLGGGGYTLRNVPRCWTHETGVVLGLELDDEMPKNDYIEYFYPEYKLHMQVSNMDNANSEENLNNILKTIDDNLKQLNLSTYNLNVNQYIPKSTLVEADIREMEQDYDDLNADVRKEDVSKPSHNYNELN
jgi:histone deacetylase 1/2